MADFFTEDLLRLKEKKIHEINAGGKRLPMLPPSRPVDPQWTCKKSGECCTIPKEVVMTKEEASVLVMHAPSTITLQFRPGDVEPERFVAMKAGPCPLYVFHTCLVYEVRPFNCRRFGCMRPDVNAEPFDDTTMSDRIKTSRVARRTAQRMMDKARPWADAHGWKV